jgi:hypothetical protein
MMPKGVGKREEPVGMEKMETPEYQSTEVY